MKKKLTGFFGFGDKGELWVCDGCGRKTTGGCSAYNKDGIFQSLIAGEYCFDCLKSRDSDATHLWIAINDSNRHFHNCFVSEQDSNPPTHLDHCALCYTYRVIQKIGSSLRATYYSIGSKSPSSAAPCCSGVYSGKPSECLHDYLRLLNNEKSPSSDEVKAASADLKRLSQSVVGQAYGYTEVDMRRNTFGYSVYWCCKCAYTRAILKGSSPPAYGSDNNFLEHYTT